MLEYISISGITHPDYVSCLMDWMKWRLVYEGGSAFINRYLIRYSNRETREDFVRRLLVTYNPAFAKAALNEIKNSIYQRTSDITREGGPKSYQDAIKGDVNGVDLLGNSMNSFIGIKILPELLSMRKVGVYVDMPRISDNPTLDDLGSWRPYVYIYQAEDIRSWLPDEGVNPNEFKRVLLRDRTFTYDDKTGLPFSTQTRYRLLTLEDTEVGRRVHVQFFDENDEPLNEEPIRLNISKIPFVCFEITESLLNDASDYQIALLNLHSSDMQYCLTANYPFFTEQYDQKAEAPYLKQQQQNAPITDNSIPDDWGWWSTSFDTTTTDPNEIKLGVAKGRRYPLGTERPAFIFPSSEPLKASMEKEKQLRDEIRLLVGLSLSNIRPKMASAESKQIDSEGLEAGLSYIGLVLEHGERKIAEYWSMYSGSTDIATINYPEKYSLETNHDKREDIINLIKLLDLTTSITHKRRILKRIAYLSIGQYVKRSELDKIYVEIDKLKVILPNMDSIIQAVTSAFLNLKGAANAYNFPVDSVDLASEEHAARLLRIAKSQTPDPNMAARGIRDLGADLQAGKDEKAVARDTTKDVIPQDHSRGVE